MSFFTSSKILAVPLGNPHDYDSILEHVPLKDRKIFEVQIVQIGSSKCKGHLWCNEVRGISYTLHIPSRDTLYIIFPMIIQNIIAISATTITITITITTTMMTNLPRLPLSLSLL